jgi:hypothetical protein
MQRRNRLKFIESFRHSFLALSMTALIAVPAVSGQEQKSSIPPLIAQLKLSDGQKKKLETHYGDNQQKIKALREDASLSEADKKARLNDLNNATIKFLTETLTSKQREKLKELRGK